MNTFKIVIYFTLAGILLAGCGVSNTQQSENKLKVVASTTIVGEVVEQIGGDVIDLTVLIPVGSDPHTFEPRPQDVAELSNARLVILNGLGLEEALEPVLETNVSGRIIHVSDGIEVLPFVHPPTHSEHREGEENHEAEQEHDGEEEHQHEQGDPHTWMDPNNVKVWVENIEKALVEMDPANAAMYSNNAAAYLTELHELDAWVQTEVNRVPAERRKLVSDHASFAYFAHRYGFEQTGLIIASLSTNAAPSAQELAELENTIQSQGVPAVFIGKTVNPALAEQVARDTGTKLVPLYTGSLSEAGGEADTYLNFMRYNVQAIVNALK